jgi:hypothetical protein
MSFFIMEGVFFLLLDILFDCSCYSFFVNIVYFVVTYFIYFNYDLSMLIYIKN